MLNEGRAPVTVLMDRENVTCPPTDLLEVSSDGPPFAVGPGEGTLILILKFSSAAGLVTTKWQKKCVYGEYMKSFFSVGGKADLTNISCGLGSISFYNY